MAVKPQTLWSRMFLIIRLYEISIVSLRYWLFSFFYFVHFVLTFNLLPLMVPILILILMETTFKISLFHDSHDWRSIFETNSIFSLLTWSLVFSEILFFWGGGGGGNFSFWICFFNNKLSVIIFANPYILKS